MPRRQCHFNRGSWDILIGYFVIRLKSVAILRMRGETKDAFPLNRTHAIEENEVKIVFLVGTMALKINVPLLVIFPNQRR